MLSAFALPYDPQALEYVGTEMTGMKEMRNLTNDRLHTNGTKALYPTFVNIGEKALPGRDAELMTIKFKAKRKQKDRLEHTGRYAGRQESEYSEVLIDYPGLVPGYKRGKWLSRLNRQSFSSLL